MRPSFSRFLAGRAGLTLPSSAPPDPILALNPIAWFRGDGWNGGGFDGRVGTEGTLDAVIGQSAPVDMAEANDQPFLPLDTTLTSSMPAAFWNFLGGGDATAYVITVPIDAVTMQLYQCGTSCVFSADAADGSFQWKMGPANEYLDYDTGNYIFTNVPVLHHTHVDLAADPPTLCAASNLTTPDETSNSGPFLDTPPGTVDATLTCSSSDVTYIAEWLFFDRALTTEEQAVVRDYAVDRYTGVSMLRAFHQSFTDSDLTAGVLTIAHATGMLSPVVMLYDGASELVQPTLALGAQYDVTIVDLNTLTVTFNPSVLPLSGTWTIQLVGSV